MITEPENDPKDGTSELMADIQSLFVLYNARQNGRRAGKRAMFVAPAGMRERVAALYGAGTSFREMKRLLPAEGCWKCANTGKPVTDHMIYLVFKEVRGPDYAKEGAARPSRVTSSNSWRRALYGRTRQKCLRSAPVPDLSPLLRTRGLDPAGYEGLRPVCSSNRPAEI